MIQTALETTSNQTCTEIDCSGKMSIGVKGNLKYYYTVEARKNINSIKAKAL